MEWKNEIHFDIEWCEINIHSQVNWSEMQIHLKVEWHEYISTFE